MDQQSTARMAYSVRESARLIGVSKNKFLEMVHGGFPHVRVGRRILIPKWALERFLDEGAK